MKTKKERKLGVWLVGARGAISTCVAYGLSGLRQRLLEPIGLATETEVFDGLPLVGFDGIELAGHEISQGSLNQSAGELIQSGVLAPDLVAASSEIAASLDARIRPGILDVTDVGRANLDPAAASLGALSPRDQIERLQADWKAFREDHGVDRIVVCYLASTEPYVESRPSWNELASFESALDAGEDTPASCIYAYAALRDGAPFVNFTPNRGSSLPALRELAREVGLPHCGNDGKTGETLMKTALAPMFAARALKVLSWQGYNMLGNRDGEALAQPLRRELKQRNKDAPLHAILKNDDLHTAVGIDFVPSLHDWKTAWDFIHFQGFLGAKMSLQFTWAGSDSALAAPLILDLVRLTDFAAEVGEVGEMDHTACYFKSPLAGGTHDFHRQYWRLLEYARKHST